MRVLSIADALYREAPGGASMVAHELGKALERRGNSVVHLAGGQSDDSSTEEDLLRYPSDGSIFNRVKSAAKAVEDFTTDGRAEVIHSHFALYDFALSRQTRRRCKIVRTFHGPWDEEGFVQESGLGPNTARARALRQVRRRLRWLVERRSLRLADRVTVLSECFRNLVVERYGIPSERIDMIPGGVDVQRFGPSPDRDADRLALGFEPDADVILSVRRLVPRMGLDLLIDAMPAILERRPKARLLIGGKGPSADALAQKVEALGLQGSVQFLGFITDDLLPVYYRAADVFVVPTRALEGFGLVTLEALASGTPVVATPVGGNVEILLQLDRRLLANEISAPALARGLIETLELRERGQYGIEELSGWVRSHYSWERYAEETERLYR